MTYDERLYYESHGSFDDTFSLVGSYQHGYDEDIEPDYDKAISYYKKLIRCAKNGNIVAQYQVASSCRAYSDMIKYDIEEDAELLYKTFYDNISKKAAENDVDAIYASACLKYRNHDTDEEEFQMWYSLVERAALNGSYWACSHLMWPFVFENHSVVNKCDLFVRMGAKGTGVYASKCQDLLARLYRFGDEWGSVTFPKDREKFIYWAKKAYANGSLEAKNQLKAENVAFEGKQSSNGASSGGCYVATAVYGSYDCPEVWTLRRYRDNILQRNIFGRNFIRMYYAVSPTIVKYFGKKKWFNMLFKRKLDVFVKKLNSEGIDNAPYSDS